MAEKEEQIARTLADAIATLPEEKKQYFMGFAEGVAAMADQAKDKQEGEDNAQNQTERRA